MGRTRNLGNRTQREPLNPTVDTPDFLIIGAGLAGIAAASDLNRAGATMTVLDKGRALGGRAATRRLDGQPIDHGAQFCTARTERFQRLLEQGKQDGWAHVWCHGYPLWRAGQVLPRDDGHPRWTFPNGMRTLPEMLGEGLTVRTGTTVESVQRDTGGIWVATDTEGKTATGRCLILNLPPVQLLKITEGTLPAWLWNRVADCRLVPCWAVAGLLDQDFDGNWPAIELEDHASLAWVARDHTRRRSGAAPAAVLHARSDWSEIHLEDNPDDVQATLMDAARDLFGIQFNDNVRIHRWRYAKPDVALGEAFLLDPDQKVGVCGDWCTGGRVEGALISGWELAAAVLETS